MINITLNGERQTVPPALTVAGLLHRFAMDPRKVAVERNLEIVPRSTFAATELAEGDAVEIIAFVGGG